MGSDKAYVFGSGTLSISGDAGKSWQTQDLGLPIEFRNIASTIHNTAHFKDVFFTSENTGYLLSKNIIYKTTNRGKSWQEALNIKPNRDKFSASAYFESLFFADENVGYAVGWFDKLFKTTDAGASWDTLRWSTSSTPFRRLTAVHFLDAETGFVAGYEIDDYYLNIGAYQHFLMKTTDGKQWDTLPNTGYFDALTLDFENESQGLLLSATGLHATNDGGLLWQDAFPNNDTVMLRFERYQSSWWAIARINSQKKLVLMKSKDHGKSWDIKPAYDLGMTISGVFDLAILQEDTLLLSVRDQILRTANGGTSWESVLSLVPESNDHFMDIYTVDERTGFLYSRLGKVWKTTNGGQQWEEIYEVPYSYQTFKIFFKNDQEGFLAGHALRQPEYPTEGILLYTKDGGQHWTEQVIPRNEGLTDMAWTPSLESVYVTGKFGTILKSDQQEVATDIESIEKTPLSVYPNPATNLVHFSRPFATGKQIEVRLLDLSGHLVLEQKLTLDKKQAASLDLQAPGQGLYILNVLTDDQRLVEKIILSGD